jgi:hypothetical protein
MKSDRQGNKGFIGVTFCHWSEIYESISQETLHAEAPIESPGSISSGRPFGVNCLRAGSR